MFWVFCCNCFISPTKAPQRKYYMSSCSHVYCERCINHTQPYCKRCCVTIKVIACDSQMSLEIRSVFCDANEKVARHIKALEYQAGQRCGLMSHHRLVEQKYVAAKAFFRDAEIKFANMKQEVERLLRKTKELELANEVLKKHLQRLKQVPPSPSPPTDSAQWFSQMQYPQSSRGLSHLSAFTPKNCYTKRRDSRPTTPSFSSCKTPSITDSCSSRFSYCKPNIPVGFTPPQKTMELLSIMNKKRDFNI